MSGFSYPEWIGEIYPPGTKRDKMLAEYAKIFPVVEINMSFRRTPVEKTIEKWRDAVPESFRFTMKANQSITHWKRLVGAEQDVVEFVRIAKGLGDKLGAILFQLPPTLKFDAAVIDGFAASLVDGTRYAIEHRNVTFVGEEPDSALRKHGLARCLNDDHFELSTHTRTGPFAYFRFHREKPYAPEELRERAEFVKAVAASGVDVYAFFSHEDNPESVKPALRFLELLA
jgi:uncharacterized protein YecE (DUF72 family)